MLSLQKRKTERQKYKNEIFCSDHLHVFLATSCKLKPTGSERREMATAGEFRLARYAGKQSPPPIHGQNTMSAICITATLAEI